MTMIELDDFRDVSSWLPVASGLAQLTLASDARPTGAAMRMEFDFKGGGGFVVARKSLSLRLPETYVLAFDLRGAAPPNKLEVKLSDPSGRNVWWWHRDAFALRDDWQAVRIRSSEIEFAWGPVGGGVLADAGAIEIAIVAGPGGHGTVWIANLRVEDHTYRAVPTVTASTALPSYEPERVLDLSSSRGWRSEAGRASQWLSVDFGTEREYGGLVIDWEPGRSAREFAVQVSNDGDTWTPVYRAPAAAGDRSYVYMPATRARYLRIDLHAPAGAAGLGIVHLEVKPFEFSRSLQAFFQNLAHDAPPGSYPKYLYNEQTYWSPVGVADGTTCALLNQEGMVEVDKGSFSIEPFLWVDDHLVTWADVEPAQELEAACLPIPSSVWRRDDLVLRTTAFATRAPDEPVLFIRYRVDNESARPRAARVYAAIRPFQVTPPWQSWQGLGGVHPIHDLKGDGRVTWVDGSACVIALSETVGFGAVAFAQGSIVDALRTGTLPAAEAVHDEFGYASGALAFDLALAPHASSEVYLAVPFTGVEPTIGSRWRVELCETGVRTENGVAELRPPVVKREPGGDPAVTLDGAAELSRAINDWRVKLGAITFDLPGAARGYIDTFKTAAAHVLISRDGAALQPGPRRYTRSWIRDGAIMAAALLRIGCVEEARAFIRWYARFQAADGNVPCCVDRSGPDWLVEHDSHGELIFTVMECFRFTGDNAFLEEMWPAVLKAVGYIDALRQTRLGPEYQAAERRARYGLLPESASHEGYLAHHVHSYWDDFWALRGLRDAATMAETLGAGDQQRHIEALRDELRDTLYASIDLTMAERTIGYVPGSVEWADFDPTATANAISLLDELPNLPRVALERTFDTYLEGFRKRVRNEIDWANYTAYEVRIIGALVQLARRADANELAAFLLDDRRPRVWNQWPEISWRDPKSPGHLGDLPHCWIGAEYMLAFRTMLVFEREAERSLVIGAGVPAEWLDGDGVTVKDLPTYYGLLSFTLRRPAVDAVTLSLAGDITADIVVRPPLAGPLRSVTVDGIAIDTFDAESARVDTSAKEIVLRT
jgi:hypothetical protein